MNKVLIFGYGYVARFLSEKIIANGNSVLATSRDSNKMNTQVDKLTLIHPDKINSKLTELKDETTHLIVSAPPNESGDVFLNQYQDILLSMSSLKWIGYLSATNVYGDHNGEYVNELSSLKGRTSKGINRIKAEGQWIEYSKENDLPLHIFRIAGIYGPERNIYERIKSNKFNHIIKHDQYFSRIYIYDLVNILLASMNKPNPINIYNVADDMPSNMSDVVDFICQRTSCSIPKKISFEDLDIDQKKESFYSENKRINNRLLKEDLGIILKYPSYREGYQELIENDN
tara:strand:+ start:119 stop:979 length:861 start_codon:yes stop_codon:yes gene_type:complete